MADAYSKTEHTVFDGSEAIYVMYDPGGASEEDRWGLITNLLQKIDVIGLLERSSDPSEPSAGQAVIWLSDGTGKGGDGDVMIAVNVDGTTKYGTLFDYSGGSAW